MTETYIGVDIDKDWIDASVHFVGVGENAEDLQPIIAEAFARALVGAG